ncbi:hypothetical protein T08_8177 [Trichinella sp. T8]|nr:hypothetical protein T08_8177 [Trichinella sp. T8]
MICENIPPECTETKANKEMDGPEDYRYKRAGYGKSA